MQQGASQTDPKLRRRYLIIAACWLKLSYELSELPANFSKPERQSQQFTTPAKLKAGMEEESPWFNSGCIDRKPLSRWNFCMRPLSGDTDAKRRLGEMVRWMQ